MGPNEPAERTTVYVRFGPAPTQEIPREWAEAILTMLCQRNPVLFGNLLAEVITGHKRTRGR
jgi:hypothetical protein